MKQFLLIPALLFASLNLFGQWTTDTETNTAVAASQTGDMQSVGTSDGKTYIAFWHDVPAPKYYEMRLQLLDANGNQLFGPEGMLVNDTVAMSSYTTLWSLSVDADNNVYVCFNGTGGNNSVYVNKISPDGAQLWGASGINPGAGFDAKLLPLPNGDVIVSWLPGNQGVMQRFGPDGTPLWANPVTIQPATPGHKTSAGELAAMSDGSFTLIIHDRGGFSPSSLPYAQRYDGNGSAMWPSPVALSTTYYTVFNRRYPLAQDGDTLYFGYAGAQGIQPYGFVQRVNPDGSLPWGIDGSRFSTQNALFEEDLQIAFTQGSGVVWALCTDTDNAQGQAGEYIQKFDKQSGARLLGDNAKVVFPVSPDYISHKGQLRTVNDQPFFLISNGDSNGVFPKDIDAVYLTPSGDFAWPEHTRPMGTNPAGVKSRINLNAPVNGQITAAWTEERPAIGESRPFAQNMQITACTTPTAGFIFAGNALETVFESNAANADSIYWEFGDGAFDSGALADHVYAAPGTYTVCQIAVNACGADTLCQSVTVEASGVSGLEKSFGLSLSPNPNHGAFALRLELPHAAQLQYRLLSAGGRLIRAQNSQLSAGKQVIDIASDLPAGSYFLWVRIDGESGVVPVVVR